MKILRCCGNVLKHSAFECLSSTKCKWLMLQTNAFFRGISCFLIAFIKYISMELYFLRHESTQHMLLCFSFVFIMKRSCFNSICCSPRNVSCHRFSVEKNHQLQVKELRSRFKGMGCDYAYYYLVICSALFPFLNYLAVNTETQ